MTNFILDDFLPYRLNVAAKRISKEFSDIYSDKFGLTVPEWRVVAHLFQSDVVSVREIHERVDMDKSKVSRAAARLENLGYVQKETSATDRRLVELSLTDKGRQMMKELAELALEYQSELEARLKDKTGIFSEALASLSVDENK